MNTGKATIPVIAVVLRLIWIAILLICVLLVSDADQSFFYQGF